MDKERLLDLISGRLDGELTEPEKEELQRELESSETARSLLKTLQDQAALLQALDAPKAPAELREKLRKRLPSKRPGRPALRHWTWMMAAAAASFLFLWGGQALQKSSPGEFEFYLQPGLISGRPPSDFHSVVLQPGRNESETFFSPPAVGYLKDGPVLVKFRGDGGQNPGQVLKARLSIDTDGDKEWEVVEESEPVTLDALSGHQEISFRFPLSGKQVGVLVEGQVKLELVGESMSAEGIQLLFPPDDSHLVLPLAEGAVHL